jgi:insulysin
VRDDARWRVFHKLDGEFGKPKAVAFVLLATPLCGASAAAAVHARLYKLAVVDALNEYAYDAQLAGLSYGLEVRLFPLFTFDDVVCHS